MGPMGLLLKFVLLLVAVLAFFYYRMIKGRRRRRELHGRERLHAAFRKLRRDRLSTASTWEERRRLREDPFGGRRIRPELLQGGLGSHSGGADGGTAGSPPVAPGANEGS